MPSGYPEWADRGRGVKAAPQDVRDLETNRLSALGETMWSFVILPVTFLPSPTNPIFSTYFWST